MSDRPAAVADPAFTKFLEKVENDYSADPSVWIYTFSNSTDFVPPSYKLEIAETPGYIFSASPKTIFGDYYVVKVLKKVMDGPNVVLPYTVLSEGFFQIDAPNSEPSPLQLRQALRESFDRGGLPTKVQLKEHKRSQVAFIDCIPAVDADGQDVQDWLKTWFLEHNISLNKYLAGIYKVPWTGRYIRDTRTYLLQIHLEGFGFGKYAEVISQDIAKARGPKEGPWHEFMDNEGLITFVLALFLILLVCWYLVAVTCSH